MTETLSLEDLRGRSPRMRAWLVQHGILEGTIRAVSGRVQPRPTGDVAEIVVILTDGRRVQGILEP